MLQWQQEKSLWLTTSDAGAMSNSEMSTAVRGQAGQAHGRFSSLVLWWVHSVQSVSLSEIIVSSTNSDSLLRSFKLAESMGHAVRQGRKARLGYKEICGAETLSQQYWLTHIEGNCWTVEVASNLIWKYLITTNRTCNIYWKIWVPPHKCMRGLVQQFAHHRHQTRQQNPSGMNCTQARPPTKLGLDITSTWRPHTQTESSKMRTLTWQPASDKNKSP